MAAVVYHHAMTTSRCKKYRPSIPVGLSGFGDGLVISFVPKNI